MSRLLARVSTSRVPVIASSPLRLVVMRSGSGEAGSGAGRGGGGGGVIREAGGAFGKMEAAHEEQYFRKLQAEQMKKLKQHLDEEIEFHKAEIKRHEEAISRHKSKKEDLDV